MAEAHSPSHEEVKSSDLTILRNRIFIMRHGQSEANARGLIVCAPNVGCSSFGLTDLGRSQVVEGCKTLQSLLQSPPHPPLSPTDDLIIASSDFKRTSETAQIVREHFKISEEVCHEPALRERDFGQFNLTSDTNYRRVWEVDARDPQHTDFDCESVASVVLRTSRLLQRLDREYKDKAILLVSHGDPLQILSTVFLGVPPNDHKTLPDLLPAAVQELK